MRRAATVLFVLLVALSGCSQLAEPVEKPTSTDPIEGTVSPTNGTQPVTDGNDRTSTSTAIHTSSPTATATVTPIATATATTMPTRTATTMSAPIATATTLPTAIATTTPNTSRFRPSTRTARPIRTPTRPPTTARTPTFPPTATRTPATTTLSTTAPTTTANRTPMSTSNPGRVVLGTIDADGETVTLRNAGGHAIDLDDYVVDFDDGQRYTIPSYTLRPGETVTIHTGRGDNAQNDLYAGFFYPVINDNGDTVLIETPNGRIIVARRVR